MRRNVVLAMAAVLLLGCRGERVPRDYGTNPGTTHPVTSSSETPTAHGMPGSAAEPSSGVEGKSNGHAVSATSPSSTIPDQAPSGTTATMQVNQQPSAMPTPEHPATTSTVVTTTR